MKKIHETKMKAIDEAINAKREAKMDYAVLYHEASDICIVVPHIVSVMENWSDCTLLYTTYR